MVSYLISTAASTIFMLMKKQALPCNSATSNANKGIALKLRKQIGKEAKADFLNSMQEVKASEEKREGAAAPILSAVPVFSFYLSSLFEYYSMLNVSAFARYLGINEILMRQYKKGNTYISDVQLQKIEDGLHRLGAYFLGLRLV